MQELIRVEKLNKSFNNTKVVANVDISLHCGEVMGFLGANGAGKTTTMRMITGFLPPDSGTITINNVNILQNHVLAKRDIGYLAEGAPLYPELTPAQILHFAGKCRKMSKSHLAERLDYVIENLQLNNVLTTPIENLSKGYKRRVGIALALLHDPKILILDEPTDGLDPLQKQEMRRLIKNISTDKAIIISTHILDEVDSMCNRCAIIAAGAIIYDGTNKDLMQKHPEQSFEQIFCQLVHNNNGN
jgi:ABC-2 type transport system ATP-binding protein